MSLRYKLHQLRAFAADGRYLPFFFQRLFRSNTWRNWMTRLIAASKPQSDPLGERERPIVEALRRDGIAPLGELLTPKELADVREYLDQRAVSDPYLPSGTAFLPSADNRPPQTHVGYYETAQVLAAPHLLALANRPEILAVAEGFLGCKPTIGYLASWWSFASEDGTAQAAENFHRDVDDWRFLKLFVYLTDVQSNNGPHIYVSGSAQDERLRKIRRYTDDEVREAFGNEAIITITGEAGGGFLEDTYGLHKGQPVQDGKRLIFQAVYSIGPLPYAPKTPVADLAETAAQCAVPLDPYVNRLYLWNSTHI